MKRPSVSVIVPTYNRSKLLGFTLESLERQAIPKTQFEVIIADDGSSDDTGETIERFKGLLNLKYVAQEDRGYRVASARNLGIKASSGDICLFIDSGVLLDERCVGEHLDFHAEKGPDHAAIGYVYGFEENSNLASELIQLIDPFSPTESIKLLSANPKYCDVREEQYRRYNDKLSDLPAPWLYFWSCHLSVQRMNLISVNMFDENYDGNWGVEDNDLGFKLHHAGVKISLLRAAKCVHYPHEKDKRKLHQEGYFNCKYFNDKFRSKETRIFLEHYVTTEFADINMLSLSSDNKTNALSPKASDSKV